MSSRRKMIASGLLLTATSMFTFSKKKGLLSFLTSHLAPSDETVSVRQVVVIKSNEGNFSDANHLKNAWNNFVNQCNLSFSDLCTWRESGSFSMEKRTLLDSKTLQTVRVWKSRKDFDNWLISEQRNSMKTLLQNNSKFFLVQDSFDIIQS